MAKASGFTVYKEFSTIGKKIWDYRAWWIWALKLLITFLACAYIFGRISEPDVNSTAFVEYLTTINGWIWVGPLLLLMPLNWGIEAKKWQILLVHVEKISFYKAYKSVLTGITFGLFTPNRLGEFIGRILYLPGKRMEATAMALLNATALTTTTVSLGIVSLITYFEIYGVSLDPTLKRTTVIALFLVIPLILGLYFHIPLVAIKLQAITNGRFARLFSKLTGIGPVLLGKLLLMSLIRFLVFSFQYYLAFRIFDVQLSFFDAAVFIPLSLFTINLLPVFPLSDIFVRESIALILFPVEEAGSIGVGLAVFSVWLINIALPALVGNLAILGERLVKK